MKIGINKRYPGVLQSMRSQSVRHDLTTEQQRDICIFSLRKTIKLQLVCRNVCYWCTLSLRFIMFIYLFVCLLCLLPVMRILIKSIDTYLLLLSSALKSGPQRTVTSSSLFLVKFRNASSFQRKSLHQCCFSILLMYPFFFFFHKV